MTNQVDEDDSVSKCDLTANELRVLKAVIERGNVPGAAEALFLSPHTVDRHMDNIKEKLGLHHNLQVAVVATRNHWL